MGVVGYFAYQNYQLKQQQNPINISPTPVEPSSVPTIDPAKDIISVVENYLPDNPIIQEPVLFYDDIYTVGYSYPNNPSASFVLVGKLNDAWVVGEGDLHCKWVRGSDADEATKNFMGPACNF